MAYLDPKEHIEFRIMVYKYALNVHKLTNIFKVNITPDKKIGIVEYLVNKKEGSFFEYKSVRKEKFDLTDGDFTTFNRSSTIDSLIMEDGVDEPISIKDNQNVKFLRFENNLNRKYKKYLNGGGYYDNLRNYLLTLEEGDPIIYRGEKAIVLNVSKHRNTMNLATVADSEVIEEVPLNNISIRPRKRVKVKDIKDLNPYLNSMSTVELIRLKNAMYGYPSDNNEKDYTIEDVYDVLNTREHVNYKGKNKRKYSWW